MSKVIMDDVDIVNLIQLGASREVNDRYQKDIVKRMSDKAINWYIQNMVPVVGRKTVKAQFDEIRKQK